jgi:type IV pilus assembly protein PilV
MSALASCGAARSSAGFSLIEVMVALVVVSIGMLGLAKMESLALSSADVSGTRTIAAIEAASLASMMHADHDYWGSASAPGANVTVTSTGTTVNVTGNATLAATGNNCTVPGATACNVSQMAAYDVQNWGAKLQTLLPGYKATILCTPTTLAAATPSPVTCTITINWVENNVAVSALQSNLIGLASPTYTLNVEP